MKYHEIALGHQSDYQYDKTNKRSGSSSRKARAEFTRIITRRARCIYKQQLRREIND